MTTTNFPLPAGILAPLAFRLRYLPLLLAVLSVTAGSLQAQCTFNGAQGTTLSQDYDTNQGPYTIAYPVLPAAFTAAYVTATTDARIEICFYGDMDASNETWTTRIQGVNFTSGNYGYTTTSANPVCQIFTLAMATLNTGINDGDLDISFLGFGAGWTVPDPAGNPGGDEFNAFVRSVSFDYNVAVTVSNPADQCQDGTDITFTGTPADGSVTGDVVSYQIFPATPGFNTTTGVLDVSAATPGQYVVRRLYSANGCDFSTDTDVSIFPTPVATIDDEILACGSTGLNLTSLFADGTTTGGTFTTTTMGATVNGNSLSFDSFGCVDITYTLTNENNCTNAPYSDVATVFFPERAAPNFQITSSTTCWDGEAPLVIELDRTSPAYTGTAIREWTATGTGVNVTISNTTADVPTLSVTPGATSLGTVRICLEETVTTTGACTADFDCSLTRCRDLTISSSGCNLECTEFNPPAEVCPIEVNSSFGFSIFGISFDFGALTGFDLYEASVVPGEYVMQNNPSLGGTLPAEISCTDLGIDVSWDAGLNDALFPVSDLLDDPILQQIGAGFICEAAMFSIPFPSGFCGDCGPRPSPNLCVDLGLFDPCILVDNFMPLGFLNFEIDGFGSICSITPRTLIIDPLQAAIEATSVAVVWADTDGDGAFDTVLESGAFIFDGSASGTGFVPNNVQGEGIITVRNVSAAIKAPYSPCVSPEGTNLIDLLPIDFIPIAGPIIRQVFTTAGLDINIAPSDVADLPITVKNDQDPQFLNFPTEYVFTTGPNCAAPVNWSSPIAIDGCTGIVIEDVAQTGGPMPGEALEVPNPNPVDPANPNLYRVQYTATACNGQTFVDSFDVIVSVGDPQLVCPGDFILPNDVDQCGRVVTGLTPLGGLGCNTTITWTAPGASPAAGEKDASGTTFPVGVTTVTYFMSYVDGSGATVLDSCDFTVTIVDKQKPSAQCRDFEIRLDNQGQAIVSIEDIEGGSTDNCTAAADLNFSIARTDMVFGESVTFDCFEEGQNTVILRVIDTAGLERRCLALVTVQDYFEAFTLTLDVPELCLESNNEEQLEFGNYLRIAYPNGTTLNHLEELGDGDDIGGVFGITGYYPSIDGSGTTRGTSPDNPGDAGYIDPVTGIYTPGNGTGFVTISYVLGIGGQVSLGVNNLEGCFIMTTDVFELRQPLRMDAPECLCIVQNDRVVDLGEVTGGLEPYTIQYNGVKLDVDNDGIADDLDGEFEFLGSFTGSAGTMAIDTNDFVQDLGQLLVDYTQPTWGFTIVDARGCEIFRSGSCDNDDENGTPEILCADLGPVALFTDEFVCEALYTWDHTLPTDNCDVILYTYTITNPDGSTEGPFDLTALLNPDITNPLPDQFTGTYNFQHVSPTVNTSTITYYAEDAVGNFTQCSFEVTVTDDDAPRFINCPEPAVIVDAPATWCSAFANYSLPLATDNCSIPVVTQVDDTGLTSGDLYPVGITINTFEAVDPTGNSVRCDVKIIVNDFHTPPTFECPDDVTMNTDAGDCGAVVTGIAPTDIEDNCLPNLTIVYRIDDAEGNELASGFDDASGNFFGLGTSTVRYSVQDMPLLLITEITHDLGNAVDGTLPVPAFTAGNPADGDYLEITNFNRAAMDVSCLMITRTHAGGVEEYAVPTFTILQPGGTLTIHFGDGTNSPTEDFFNVPGAANLAAGEPASYVVSLSRSIIDVAVMNGFDLTGTPAAAYWSGNIAPVSGAGIIRTTVWDTNTAADFAPGEACLPTTIGTLNPGLAQPTPNGAATAIQAQPTVRVECDFTVTVSDREPAVCGLYGEAVDPQSGAIDVAYGECIETVYTVTDAFTVADVNLNIEGMAGDMGNLTFTLISPEGTEVVLATAVCAGTNEVEFTFDGDFGPGIEDGCGILNSAGQLVMPVGDIEIFNGEAAAGDWILQIGHNGQESTAPAAFTSSILFITPREAYPDYTTTLENDLGECGADYTWNHAILFDNCPGGTILWTIVDENGTILMSQGLPIFPENTEVTFFFPVGVSTVTYALTDANGNTSSCSFDVTVNDTEFPVITCPADVTIQLEGGDCEEAYTPTDYTATDNCAVVDIFGIPPFSQLLPIGENEIQFNVADAAGNITTCTYVVTILEYIPANPQMACIDQINIHLQADCEQEIIPAMVLAGREYYCFDNYVLTLLQRNDAGTFDTINPAVVGVDQIGEEIRYQVYDPRNDESCWGRIDVGFFEAPEFICPSDATVSCNAATGTDLLGVPVLQSCALAGATVSHADTLQRNNSCDDPRAILRRTWKVTDAFGNSASCVQTITIEAFDLATVRFPVNLDGETNPAIYCADAANDPTLTDPENTGFPFVEDGSNIFTTNFCSASYLYTDEVFNICAGSYEILRTWKVRNTCQPVVPGVNPIEAVQIIRVLDFQNPQITCQDDLTISTSSIDCNGAYLIPEPVVETGCTNWQYTVSVSNGVLSQLPNGTYLVSGLDEGVYTIRYEVEDECGRYSECIFNLTVVDQVGPTAACEDGLNVSLDGNGQAIISAADVDGNSQDLCGDVQLEIRRLYELNPDNCQPTTPFYTDWGPSAGVNCCDLEELVTVELRVTDEDGNSSICWTQILIEDKLAPVCLAPEDVTITCQAYNAALPNDINDATEAQLDALFGTAGVTDNCSAAITQTITGEISNCGIGQLVRTFTATDGSGLTNILACVQRINIVGVFDYQIVFPTDVSGTCAEIPEYEALVFNDLGCDLLTVTTQVDTLRTIDAGDECFKLRITYDAVNWCEFNSLGEPYLLPRDGRNGRNPETEPLYLNVIPGPLTSVTSDDVAFISRFADRVFNGSAPQSDRLVDDGNDINSNDNNGVIDARAYAQDDSRGAFRYVQYIKVYDEVAPVITVTEVTECFTGDGDNCTATVDLTFTATDECSMASVTAEIDVDFNPAIGFQPTRTLTATELTIDVTGAYAIRLTNTPVGEHAVRIHANDGCGNSDNAILEFCVSPDKAPTPICIQTLTVTLTDDGTGGGIAAIWASDFIASPITDCFGNLINDYSLYSNAEAGAAGFLPASGHLGITLTCDDLASSGGTGFPVRLYAFDAAGNTDYCQVFVEIQSGITDPCNPGDTGNLAGVIVDEQQNAIEGVTVTLTGAAGQPSEQVTAAEGTFSFTNLVMGADYTVSPAHYQDYMNGVRTSDIVGITRHILNTEALSSPYSMLAADVDGNASIDVGDIISIRRLILGQTDVFPGNMPSWLFVPATYEFPAQLNPWQEAFPTVANYNNFVGSAIDADFVGVKLGDINQSARPNNLVAGVPRSLDGTLELEADELKIRQGATYRVPVTAAALTEVDGYQFTLAFDRALLEVTDIEPGLVAAGNFGWNLASEGLITTSWNWNTNDMPTDWNGSEVLFTLIVQANTAGALSEGLELGSRFTAAEAYERNTGNLRQPVLVFNEANLPAVANELLQNVPNPVRHQTIIAYTLAAAQPEVVVSIRDAAGRLVREFRREGTAGYNSLVVDNQMLGNAAGVYSYTVTAGDWVATKRMIVLK